MTYEQRFGEDIVDGMNDQAAKIFREKCNCLESCKMIKYDMDMDRISRAGSQGT